MNKKIIIKLIALFIGLIFAIAFIEIFMKSTLNKQENIFDSSNNTSTISTREKEKEDRFIDETNNVLSLLQKRDYEVLYSKLSDMYKKAKYPTFEIFKKYMDSIIKEDSIIQISDLVNHPNGYNAEFTIDGDKKINVVVDENGESIMFDLILDIFSVDISTSSSEVNIDFNYQIKYYTKLGYCLVIKNKTKKPIQFEIYKSSHVYGNSKYNKDSYFLVTPISERIEAEETIIVEIQYSVPYSLMFPPDLLELNYGVDGSEYTATISIDYNNVGEDGDDW